MENKKNNKKILALVVLYFGKLPNTFPLWMETCRYNQEVDFFVITDDVSKYKNIPDNVKIIFEDERDFERRCHDKLGIDCDISGRPYKTCDYRPVFNLLYDDILNRYEYFGQCELDMLFGRIGDFIDEHILKAYKKVFNYGHLTIYKNDLFLFNNLDHVFGGGMTYRQLLEKKELCNSDENFNPYSINLLYDSLEEPIYEDANVYIADIAQDHYQLRQVHHYGRKIRKDRNIHQIFYWNKGNLYCYKAKNNKILRKKCIYIHLQKRTMKNCVNYNDMEKGFLIIPDAILPYQLFDYKFILDKSRNKMIDKQWIKAHYNGLCLRLSHLLTKDYANAEIGKYMKKKPDNLEKRLNGSGKAGCYGD